MSSRPWLLWFLLGGFFFLISIVLYLNRHPQAESAFQPAASPTSSIPSTPEPQAAPAPIRPTVAVAQDQNGLQPNSTPPPEPAVKYSMLVYRNLSFIKSSAWSDYGVRVKADQEMVITPGFGGHNAFMIRVAGKVFSAEDSLCTFAFYETKAAHSEARSSCLNIVLLPYGQEMPVEFRTTDAASEDHVEVLIKVYRPWR